MKHARLAPLSEASPDGSVYDLSFDFAPLHSGFEHAKDGVEGLGIFQTLWATLSNASRRALDLLQYECVKPVH